MAQGRSPQSSVRSWHRWATRWRRRRSAARGGSARCSSRSRQSASSEPRLFSAKEWISSTTTVSAIEARFPAMAVCDSMELGVSGVVRIRWGRVLPWRSRSFCSVSPVRTCMRICCAIGRACIQSFEAGADCGGYRYPAPSAEKRRWRQTAFGSVSGMPRASANGESTERNAARVLPLPVGARIKRVLACARYGAAPASVSRSAAGYCPVNQALQIPDEARRERVRLLERRLVEFFDAARGHRIPLVFYLFRHRRIRGKRRA